MSTTEEFIVTGNDVLCNNTIRPSALLKYIHQVGEMDLQTFNVSYNYLRENNMAFILTRQHLNIYSPICLLQNISITSWASSIEGAYYYRNVRIFVDDKVVAELLTQWVLIDYVSRHIIRITPFPSLLVRQNIDTVSVKLTKSLDSIVKNIDFTVRKEKIVQYTELDMNEHLNNANYTDILLNTSPISILNKRLASVELYYSSEAVLNDVLDLQYKIIDKNSFYTTAYNGTHNKPCFNAIVSFTDDFNN